MLPTINLLRKIRIAPRAHRLLSMADVPRKEGLDFHNNYEANQVKKILSAVNLHSENELCQFNLSMQRAKKITLRKQKQGDFKCIEDILELDGFGVTVLEKFCNSILSNYDETSFGKAEEDEQVSTQVKKPSQFVAPSLTEPTRRNINSCVAFHIDLGFIGWTKLSLGADDSAERPIIVEDWVCFDLDSSEKKLSLSDLIAILTYVDSKIPDADAYVLESLQAPQASKQQGNPVIINVNLQKSQMLAMIGVMMASRKRNIQELDVSTDEQAKNEQEIEGEALKPVAIEQQKVFFLKNFLSSRVFRNFIGNERVSAEHAVEEILSTYSPDKPSDSNNPIDVSHNLRQHYKQSNRIQKEFLGQSFLNGITFLKLCVLKCRTAIDSLNSRKNIN